jgi:transcriptional regulator with XRE-family HTH domain
VTSAARLLREARRAAGLSQRALGIAAGIPQSTVARVESGTIYPRSDTLERLLGAAGHMLVSEPKAGYGVDRTQIRAMLALTPADRLRLLTADARSLMALDRARVEGS